MRRRTMRGMSLSNLASMNASASVSTPSPDITDPTTAINAGMSSFENAFSQAGGSFAGTTAGVAAIAAGLPDGAVKQLVSTVSGDLSAIAAGAAMGSVIPGYGTAIGAAVGAIVGIVNQIAGGSQQAPQGEFRSRAEQYCFPALPNEPAPDATPSQLAQAGFAVPGTWADIATHSGIYQAPTPIGVVDPVSGQDCPLLFDFSVGWISPPGSTADTTSAAIQAANVWGLQTYMPWFGGPAHQAQLNQLYQALITTLGSQSATNQCLSLIGKWYHGGMKWSGLVNYGLPNIPPIGKVSSDGQFATPNVSATAWRAWFPQQIEALQAITPSQQKTIIGQELQASTIYPVACDFRYYPAPTAYMLELFGTWTAVVALANPGAFYGKQGTGNCSFVACPDTTLCLVAEHAVMVATGVLTEAAAVISLLHMMMGLAWRWRRGQIEDATAEGKASGGAVLEPEHHPNFSRIIAILISLQKRGAAQAAAASAAARLSAASLAKAAAPPPAPAPPPRPMGPAATAIVAPPPHPWWVDALVGVAVAGMTALAVRLVKQRRRVGT